LSLSNVRGSSGVVHFAKLEDLRFFKGRSCQRHSLRLWRVTLVPEVLSLVFLSVAGKEELGVAWLLPDATNLVLDPPPSPILELFTELLTQIILLVQLSCRK